jgi:hypothetical protein
MTHQVGDRLYVPSMGGWCRVTSVFAMYPDNPAIAGQLCTGISVEPINDEEEPCPWKPLPKHP